MLPVFPPPVVMTHALVAVAKFGDPKNILIVADMTEPNRDPRFWVIDLRTMTVVLRTQVAHGSGSDPRHTGIAHRFGNQENSFMTSLGAYRIGQAYPGHSGLSYHLVGLSPSDSHAVERDIELHRANYVSPRSVGWSEGCLAISPSAFVSMQNQFGDLSGALVWVDGHGVVPPLGSPRITNQLMASLLWRESLAWQSPNWTGLQYRSCRES